MVILSVFSLKTEKQQMTGRRLLAKFFDFVVVFLLALLLPYPLGALAAFFYSLFADASPIKSLKAQSFGKKVLRLKVQKLQELTELDWRDSVLRNAPIGIFTFFGLIPVWGWLISLIVGVPVIMMEIYFILTREDGRRLGDQMAETKVVYETL